jgi:hypothetical protein
MQISIYDAPSNRLAGPERHDFLLRVAERPFLRNDEIFHSRKLDFGRLSADRPLVEAPSESADKILELVESAERVQEVCDEG